MDTRFVASRVNYDLLSTAIMFGPIIEQHIRHCWPAPTNHKTIFSTGLAVLTCQFNSIFSIVCNLTRNGLFKGDIQLLLLFLWKRSIFARLRINSCVQLTSSLIASFRDRTDTNVQKLIRFITWWWHNSIQCITASKWWLKGRLKLLFFLVVAG